MKVIDFDIIQRIESDNRRFFNTLAHDMDEALSLCKKARVLSEKAGYGKGVLDSLFYEGWYHTTKQAFSYRDPLET